MLYVVHFLLQIVIIVHLLGCNLQGWFTLQAFVGNEADLTDPGGGLSPNPHTRIFT